MSDRFHPLTFDRFTNLIFGEFDSFGRILDIPSELFFRPSGDDVFKLRLGPELLATPYGVAAGPHTQLAPGILASWLCGARTLELKTVQKRGVEVGRPCIRMRDEGLNVEWSQELDPDQSFRQYLDAWVLIHVLHRRLDFPGEDPETSCDISVGYDLEGLQSPEMRQYFSRVRNAGELLDDRLKAIRLSTFFREEEDIEIPTRLAHRVTLSTLHGCPAGEIGAMLRYLMLDEDLDVQVKLNPSLLGAEFVRHILHDALGFKELEPDEEAFASDLKIDEAVDLISEMRNLARKHQRSFGIKLSNTLPLRHRGDVFPDSEKTMYLSGRPLHPLTVQIAAALRNRCGEDLNISFCGGADAFNASDLLSCGFAPITTCSDLLRPGGIPRLGQYLEETRSAMHSAQSIDDFILRRARASDWDGESVMSAASHNLKKYAERLLKDPAYQFGNYHRNGIKARDGLELLDCIAAPCTSSCGITQKVPEYLRRIAAGDPDAAASTIREDNPLPVILGRTCHHPCEPTCLRSHYDEPLAIRDLKRFAMDYGKGQPPHTETADSNASIAVIGGGPCGLAVAWECRRAGLPVTVFEADDRAGGMVHATIPVYRAAEESVLRDLRELEDLGVDFRFNMVFGRDFSLPDLREAGFGAVVLAAGAPRGRPLGLEGEQNEGTLDGLSFLRERRRGEGETLEGMRVGVIGAGDVAMDCARTARRLKAEVNVIYRRRKHDAPAHPEEIRALGEEGVGFIELLSPESLEIDGSRLSALFCRPMKMGAPGPDGRPKPVPSSGETIRIPLDLLIVAIGQEPDPSIVGIEGLETTSSGWISVNPATGRTSLPGVWAGGDAVRGPSSIVAAAGDGRSIAADLIASFQLASDQQAEYREPVSAKEIIIRRSRRIRREKTPELPPEERTGFDEVIQTLKPDAARREASRCLDCDQLCSTCVTVCPNRAFMTLSLEPFSVAWPAGENGETRRFHTRQAHQVLLFADWCNACGNCSEFCPTTGHPHLDKARLTADDDCFETSTDPIFRATMNDGVFELALKSSNRIYRMRFEEALYFSGPAFNASIDRQSGEILNLEPHSTSPKIHDWESCHALLSIGRALEGSRPEMLEALFP